jgi:hypothetical protein
MAIIAQIQPRGSFQIQTFSGEAPRLTKIFLSGLSTNAVNYVIHGLPTGAVPIATILVPGVTGGGLWAESQPADASQSFALTAAAAAASSVTVYTGTIPDGVATNAITLTAAAGYSGGATVYTGTVNGGASNAYVGSYFDVTGFDNSSNNGVFLCIASTATTLTLNNGSGVADTHAATATTGGLIGSYLTVAGFGNSANNGTFQVSAQTATTITLSNSSGVAQTATAGTATGGFVYLEPATGGATYGSLYMIY